MNNILKRLEITFTVAVALTIVTLQTYWPGDLLAEPSVSVDPLLQAYEPVVGVKGNLSSVGSDTLNNLMTFWVEKFEELYPNVAVQVEGKGSSTAPPALISATAQLGPMSREMKASEVDQFVAKFGYKPTPIRVAIDALAVFVNKDNPVQGLTFEEVDAIFSKARRRGHAEDLTSWGQLNLQGEWAKRQISVYGRNSASGTYGLFKEMVLDGGDYKDSVKEQPGSSSVVQSVATDKFGIGYSGIGYKTAGVRAVPLAKQAGMPFHEATMQEAYSGNYPLARFLYIYVAREPGKDFDLTTKELLRFVLSKQGQEVVVKDGYFPLPAKMVDKELKKIM